MAETITRQYREPFVESAGLGITNEGLRLLNQALPTSTYTGRSFVQGASGLETSAQQAAADLGNLVGAGTTLPSGVQEGSIEAFMSPYQQDVIDASLTALQREQDKGLMSLRDSAVRSGAFGGGREAAAIGEFEATGAAARATLESQLRQQAFQDATARRGQAFAQQQALANQRAGLAQNQFALSNFQRAGQAADVANLGQLGAFRQGLTQSQLAADQQAAQTAAYEPFGRLSTYGTGLTGLAGGVAGQQFQQPAAPSPFSTALSTALGIGGLFGKFR